MKTYNFVCIGIKKMILVQFKIHHILLKFVAQRVNHVAYQITSYSKLHGDKHLSP